MESSKSLSDPLLRSSNSLDDACTAPSTECGDICGERSGLQILDEFRKLYEKQIASINYDDSNASALKMKIMEEWIRDLDAQNVMLVKTVQELEEAAYQRVKILEDKLKHTSHLINDNMSRFQQPTHHRLNDLSERLDFLEDEEGFFKQKINNLQNDITGLLELIRRGYYERRWSLKGINLCELKDTDIPIPFTGEDEPQEHSIPTNKDLTEPDKFKLLSENEKIMSSEDSGRKTIVEHHVELNNLQEELQKKHKEVERLKNQLHFLEKEALEAREALTLEVAEKHDQAIMLKDQMANLEDQYRQSAMQMQFKDDIIKEMRNQLKQIQKKGSSLSPSAQLKKCTGVTWSDVSTHQLTYQSESHGNDETLKYLTSLKTIMESEYYELIHVKNILIEILKTLNFHEKRSYEKGLSDAHQKLQDIGNLLENYKIQTTAGNSDCNTFISNTCKLTQAIEILSKICLEKGNGIQQVKLVKIFHESNNQQGSVEKINEPCEKPRNVCRQDFNMMEEFRICAVEAQAAVEDLQEEIASTVANLSCRHQLFTDVTIALEKNHQEFIKANDDLLNAISRLKDHIEEKVITKKTIIAGGMKLKDFKDEMNECLVKLKCRPHNETSTDQEKLTERKLSTALDLQLVDKVMDEIDYIVCNIQVLISKEDSSCKLLHKCKDQLQRVDNNFDELKKFNDGVLRDNNLAKDEYEENLKKLEKLERELDNAHTRMQDHLEDIMQRSQQYEDSTDDPSSNIEIEELKNAMTSKDKLIDEYVARINQHLEENKYLLEESKRQNETIEHLREALVEAKKCLDRQCGQKSVGDVWTAITPTVFNNGDVHDI
ncbi:uncharacterized protein LOC107048277 isoform X2 [Diachasma alloeum]|uniref:uncharacterized protein LOC107048277 isoform X2 n=1 Tax=Diachasma alloeum TaxID=454923 RepID=UPI00073845A0|nr:uncharacterized protein LOC107048277 isoform X2 [Diachasma alloeum]